MKLHFRVAAALALLAVGTSAPSSGAAGLPYLMSGSVEEQARIAALQLASGVSNLSAVVGDNFNSVDWFQVGSLTSFNFSPGGDLDLPSLTGVLAWDTSLFNTTGVLTVTAPAIQSAATSVPQGTRITVYGGYFSSASTIYVDGTWYKQGMQISSIFTSTPVATYSSGWTYSSGSSSAVYETSKVTSATDSISVSPSLGYGGGDTRILINGVAVVSATASQPIPLAIGDNDIVIETQWPSVTATGDAIPEPIYRTFVTRTWRINRPANDAPEIGVRSSSDLTSGATLIFNHASLNSTVTNSMVVTNSGSADLNGLRVTITGPDAAEFRVMNQPAVSIPWITGSSAFSLGFTPTSMGKKTAVAHVWSNDEDESPFDLVLQGTYGSKAEFTMSLPGNKLAPGGNSFTWDPGSGASKYVLWFGSTPGGYDRGVGTFNSGVSATTVTSPGDGQTVYATLWTLVGSTWQSTSQIFQDYVKTKARMTEPANGSNLANGYTTFRWDAGLGVTSYALWLGTAPGSSDIYGGDQTAYGSQLTRTITAPMNGKKIYATLFSRINGEWQSNSYIYTGPPSQSAQLDASFGYSYNTSLRTLGWGTSFGVTQSILWIGSAFGGHDLGAKDITLDFYSARSFPTSSQIDVPVDGGPVYCTLWSLINGAWQSNHTVLYADTPSNGEAYPARLTSPANTTTLGSTSVDFTWDAGVGASQYALWIGSQPDGYDLHSSFNGTALSKNVTLPGDGRRVFVTLHSLISGAWESNSYYFDSPTTPPPVAATITSPAANSTLTDASLALTWNDGTDVTSYALWVGSRPQGWDIYAAVEGTNHSRTVTVPTDGRPLYVTLHSWAKGAWLQTTQIFNAKLTEGGKQKARLITPANGSTLTGAETTFTWDAGVGATGYVLWAGSAAGGYDALATTLNTDLTRTVTLPTDGRKLHVTLWSRIDNAWQSNSYLFTAAKIDPVKATMISPADGTTFTSSSATFTWNTGTKVSLYALWIGHTPGARDIHASSTPSGLTQTVTTLPTDGSPVYVTLWSLINGAWQSSEYIYNALMVQ